MLCILVMHYCKNFRKKTVWSMDIQLLLVQILLILVMLLRNRLASAFFGLKIILNVWIYLQLYRVNSSSRVSRSSLLESMNLLTLMRNLISNLSPLLLTMALTTGLCWPRGLLVKYLQENMVSIASSLLPKRKMMCSMLNTV